MDPEEISRMLIEIIKKDTDANARLSALTTLTGKRVIVIDDAGMVGEYVKWEDVLETLVGAGQSLEGNDEQC